MSGRPALALTAWRLGVLGFALACLVVAVVGWTSYRRLVEFREAARWVEHSLRVRSAADALLSLLKDAETGQRGLLITGEPSYIQPYETALASIPRQLEQLRALTRDNRTQQEMLVALDGLIRQKLDELAETVRTYQSGGVAAAARMVLSGEGKRAMDEIRTVVGAIRGEEDRVLAERRTVEDQRARAATYTTVGGLGLALVFLIAATVLLARAIRERSREQAARTTAERVAAAIAESESRFRVTLASIGDAVIATDDQGRVTLMNGVAETLTGWTRVAAMGRALEDVLVIVNEETRQPADNPVRRVLREGQIAGLANHTVLISKAGREIPIDDSAAPIRGEEGSVVGVVMIFRDVTERRRAEDRFRRIVESTPNAIVMVSTEGQITLVNSQTERLFGYGRDELVGQSVEVLVPLRFRAHHPQDRQAFFADPKSRPMGVGRDLYGLRKDGSEFPVEIGLSPIETEEGMIVLGAIVDISARRHAERERAALLRREQAARAEAERTTRMLRNVQFVTDAALGEVSLDGLMRESLAHVRATMGGDTATILLLAEDGTHLIPTSSDGLREELAEEVRIPLGRGIAGRIALSDAGMIFADLAAEEVVSRFLSDRVKSLVGAPLRVGSRLIGVVHVGASVPQRFTEEDLKLLGLVADRVALFIERARLHAAERAARSDAEVANRAKDEFLATVSHELREPIHAILGWVQLVRTGKGGEVTLTRALEVIERNAKLQERVVSDLLDVSRSITGQLRLEIQPIDLVAVIGAALDVVRPAADAKGIRLETVFESVAAVVSGDPGRLQQVLWNVLSNAIRFTPRGGRVEVRLRRVASQVELMVRDTGEGISPEFLPHVFERFRQATRPRGESQGGLGLGLAIVRHLVELHGGTVHAESPGEGHGATFTLKLPILAVQVPVSGTEGMPSAPRGDRPPEALFLLDGVRLLVVDDETGARELLRTVLEASGGVVTAVGSAAEALGALQQERPDVLISDVAMPGEDGYRLIRKVRALPPELGGRIPAIAVTAHARAEDRTRALLAGFHLHVPKPVEAAELVAVIASVLARTVPDRARGAGPEGRPAS